MSTPRGAQTGSGTVRLWEERPLPSDSPPYFDDLDMVASEMYDEKPVVEQPEGQTRWVVEPDPHSDLLSTLTASAAASGWILTGDALGGGRSWKVFHRAPQPTDAGDAPARAESSGGALSPTRLDDLMLEFRATSRWSHEIWVSIGRPPLKREVGREVRIWVRGGTTWAAKGLASMGLLGLMLAVHVIIRWLVDDSGIVFWSQVVCAFVACAALLPIAGDVAQWRRQQCEAALLQRLWPSI